MDDALIGILPNDLMLVGARTGRGKTELATTIAYNAAEKMRNVVFFALEADKWEIQRRMKYRKLAEYHRENYKEFKFPRFREWLSQGFSEEWESLERLAEHDLNVATSCLEVIYKGEKYSAEDFVKDLEALEHVDLIVIDHLHYFDITERTETEGLKKAIHAIRSAAIYHSKPIILLAHLRKGDKASASALPMLDDFHGHSDIVKVATTVLLIAPASGHEDIGLNPTYFHIAKCRTAGEVVPFAGVMSFDFKMSCYSENYFIERASFFKDPEPIDSAEKIPAWAKRAIRPRVFGGHYGGPTTG